MGALLRALQSLDRLLARIEATLLCALLLCLVAGGSALVFQQTTASGGASMAPWILLLPAGLCGLAAAVALRGTAGADERRARSERWALLAVFLVATYGLLQLGTALDLALRAMVLWIGVLGASLATSRRRHITIEVLDKVLPDRAKRVFAGVVCVSAIAVLLVCVAVSWRYLQDNRVSGRPLFTLADGSFVFRRWWAQTILPVGFLIMAGRFAEQLLEVLRGIDPRRGPLAAEEGAP